jgi:hypothetical protein
MVAIKRPRHVLKHLKQVSTEEEEEEEEHKLLHKVLLKYYTAVYLSFTLSNIQLRLFIDRN